VKYERIYLFEHGTLPALRESLEEWFGRYNTSFFETFGAERCAKINLESAVGKRMGMHKSGSGGR
jgi:hypothetical protein